MNDPADMMLTVYLYMAVIGITTITAFFAFRKEMEYADGAVKESVHINKVWFCISFLCAWMLLAFSACGKDYPTYKDLFLKAGDLDYLINYHNLEVGFSVFNHCIRRLTDNAIIYFILVSFLFIFLVYLTLYKMRDHVHFGWGVFAFVTVFYLQEMNLKRIYFAAAIVFLATYYLIQKRYKTCLIFIVLATLIHTSAIVMMAPLFFFVIKGEQIVEKEILLLMTITGIVLVYVSRYQLLSAVSIARYSNYGVFEGGIGLLQIAYHLPVIYIIFRNNNTHDPMAQRYREVGIVYILYSFAIGIMGYFIMLLGRCFVYFIFPFALAPGMCSLEPKEQRLGITYNDFLKIALAAYFILRLIIYLKISAEADGIEVYKSIFMNNAF